MDHYLYFLLASICFFSLNFHFYSYSRLSWPLISFWVYISYSALYHTVTYILHCLGPYSTYIELLMIAHHITFYFSYEVAANIDCTCLNLEMREIKNGISLVLRVNLKFICTDCCWWQSRHFLCLVDDCAPKRSPSVTSCMPKYSDTEMVKILFSRKLYLVLLDGVGIFQLLCAYFL